MEISHVIKIIGSAELPEPLEINKDYLFSINAGITDINKKSDEQGGYIFTYKAKQRTVEVLKHNGEVLKAKDKTSQSQKLRRQLMAIDGSEEFYQNFMKTLRAHLEEVIDYMGRLDNAN